VRLTEVSQIGTSAPAPRLGTSPAYVISTSLNAQEKTWGELLSEHSHNVYKAATRIRNSFLYDGGVEETKSVQDSNYKKLLLAPTAISLCPITAGAQEVTPKLKAGATYSYFR
jgi:hypothetical protein